MSNPSKECVFEAVNYLKLCGLLKELYGAAWKLAAKF